ncbi:cytochrome o ubiquinol oxidase subunit IV [Sphingopyxis terrae]|uniref:Cytochrome bo(3) ubiquinol oxidase subunit 4 n=1 Tax=Sphingopyxis terrae subsp. ummariensis TaxID=429001 RepID=A0A1Y6FVF7_9SPHN|nr:cytochrome o ubiquinol oxidase subunit IV [Sphingopyxis terrae]PCF91354.1 cytochrome o ubiquinol oxidase subunit IV [Sphingopyxis terrae subsp. ummariensis]SMQ76533.1 cytochrome bb3 quinol oxidase subunit 4 [Sphingopyxis terrae subsp. ummariensis]
MNRDPDRFRDSDNDSFERDHGDAAPGGEELNEREFAGGARSYAIGLLLAALLTCASFLLPQSGLVWAPALPVALAVLALAQIGIHLVFFLHVTTGPDNVNNILALVFGIFVVALLLLGSIWIMAHLDHAAMAPAAQAAAHR